MTDAAPAIDTPIPGQFAGLWRRSAAFLLDWLMLVVGGCALGAAFSEQFEAMGAWGRLVGFAIAVAYFGILESHLGNGRTLGKRLLGIRVVALSGQALALDKALLRAAVFCTPIFLNKLSLGINPGGIVLPVTQGVLVFGLGAAIVYLLVFNRRTRQSVHDLLVGAVVVRHRSHTVSAIVPLWRGHLVSIGVLMVLVAGSTLVMQRVVQNSIFTPLIAVATQVEQLPGVRNAGVTHLTQQPGNHGDRRLLTVTAVLNPSGANQGHLTFKIVDIIMRAYPQGKPFHTISISFASGYDIGIWSHWRTAVFGATPDQWRAAAIQNVNAGAAPAN